MTTLVDVAQTGVASAVTVVQVEVTGYPSVSRWNVEQLTEVLAEGVVHDDAVIVVTLWVPVTGFVLAAGVLSPLPDLLPLPLSS